MNIFPVFVWISGIFGFQIFFVFWVLRVFLDSNPQTNPNLLCTQKLNLFYRYLNYESEPIWNQKEPTLT